MYEIQYNTNCAMFDPTFVNNVAAHCWRLAGNSMRIIVSILVVVGGEFAQTKVTNHT